MMKNELFLGFRKAGYVYWPTDECTAEAALEEWRAHLMKAGAVSVPLEPMDVELRDHNGEAIDTYPGHGIAEYRFAGGLRLSCMTDAVDAKAAYDEWEARWADAVGDTSNLDPPREVTLRDAQGYVTWHRVTERG